MSRWLWFLIGILVIVGGVQNNIGDMFAAIIIPDALIDQNLGTTPFGPIGG